MLDSASCPPQYSVIYRDGDGNIQGFGCLMSGAIDVTVEIDQQTHRVRAIAMGAAEMHVKDPGGSISEAEARAIAARSMDAGPDALTLAAATPGVRVYQGSGGDFDKVRAVDWEGMIRVQRSRALVRATPSAGVGAELATLWARTAVDGHGHVLVPGLLMMFERHVIDLSGVETLEQARALAAAELDGHGPDMPVVVVAIPRI